MSSTLPTVHRRHYLPTFLAALVVTIIFATPPEAAEADERNEVACLVNQARRSAGAPALRLAPDLSKVAQAHSAEMARTRNLHHNPRLGSDVRNWSLVGENVGHGPSVGAVHNGFMGSSGHRRNMVDERFTQLGVGVATSSDGRRWVTQVFRRPSTTMSTQAISCGGGSTTSVAIVGDWNGDGRETPGKFTNGRWDLSNGLNGTVDQTVTFGRAGDVPIVGDWNGDGRDSPGVVRGSTWYLTRSTGSGAAWQFDYGRLPRGDVPIAGDWNANGRDTVGIIRDGEWHLRHSLSSGPGQTIFTYGRITRGDRVLVGDWNGDGRDTIGIVRRGEWHLRHSLSSGPGQTIFTYGRVLAGDVPVIGDWNGNRRSGVGIVRGSDWHLRNSQTPGHADKVVSW